MSVAFRVALAATVFCGMAGALYATGPPPGHTGGFGEPSCTACHFESPIDDPGGKLSLRGVPGRYESGQTYSIEVILVRPGLARGGFQMSARTADGAQAGVLEPTSDAVAIDSLGGVLYARHTGTGSVPPAPDSIAWTLNWRAPQAAGLPLVFHVAANAGNGDDSEFGDFIYLKEVRVTAP